MREWCTIFLTIGLMNVCCAGVGTVCTYVGFHRAGYFNVSSSVRLLYGESHGVTWSDLALSDRLPPLLNLMYMDVLGLDYHYQKGYLFYSGWGQIWRLSINEPEATSEAMVVVKDSSGASSVAVDWVRDRVYWTSPGTQTVHRATLEGSERAIVVTNTGTLNNYSNIVLDPYTRLLFLAVDGASFIRTDLEGGDRTNVAVIGHSDKKIVSLALDTHQRRVYVSARHDYLPQILSCEYDGTGAVEYDLTEDWWNMISSIGVYRGQLFWTHHGWRERDSAWKANVSFSGALSWEKEYTARGTVLDPETKIWALKVYHEDVQTPRKQDCVLAGLNRGESVASAHNQSSLFRVNLVTLFGILCYFVFLIVNQYSIK